MTSLAPHLEERRILQLELKKLKPRLARHKLTRELARQTGIHINTLRNYLDGYATGLEEMQRIKDKADELLITVTI